jgi:hypothetical protein
MARPARLRLKNQCRHGGADHGDDAAGSQRARHDQIAEDQRRERNDGRELAFLRAPDQQHQAAHQDQQADGDHDHREHRLADQAAEQQAFDGQADEHRDRQRHADAHGRVHAARLHRPPDQEGTDDQHLADRHVEDLAGAVDDDEAHRHQRVQQAEQGAVERVVEELDDHRGPALLMSVAVTVARSSPWRPSW